MPRDLPVYESFPQAYVWLRPPEELAQALAAHRDRWWWPRGCHLPEPHRLHLTLQALGPLDDETLAGVARALSSLGAQAFDLELAWSGVWSGNEVAVARPRADPGLANLHAGLCRCLRGRCVARNWSPHVTLAWKVPRAGAAPLEPLHWPVREFLLVRSWMRPWEPVQHEVLQRYALAPLTDTPCHPRRSTSAA